MLLDWLLVCPADMSDGQIEKHENKGMGSRLFKAAVSGTDSLHFHLTVNKLMRGEDVYFLSTPVEAKGYEEDLKNGLVTLKD